MIYYEFFPGHISDALYRHTHRQHAFEGFEPLDWFLSRLERHFLNYFFGDICEPHKAYARLNFRAEDNLL